MSSEHYFEINKNTWNKKVSQHLEGKMYDMKAFRAGKSSLNSYELEGLGNVKGRSLLHLQCHFGQDTLSLARMGAKCVGVDFSEEGIKVARQLNEDLGLGANFICCNVLDTNSHLKEKFDIVFTSYGVLGWLPDMNEWAEVVVNSLKKGGTFYMIEFHPIVWMFDYTSDKVEMKYGYQQEEVIYEEYQGTYGKQGSEMTSKEYGWNHGIGQVVTALCKAGLHIEFLEEYNESPYDVLPNLVKTKNNMYKMQEPIYPLLYAIKASKL